MQNAMTTRVWAATIKGMRRLYLSENRADTKALIAPRQQQGMVINWAFKEVKPICCMMVGRVSLRAEMGVS